MPSHMQDLLARVMLGDDRDVEEAFKKLLAVVEAARQIADTASRIHIMRECGVTLESMEILDEALARLDEEATDA